MDNWAHSKNIHRSQTGKSTHRLHRMTRGRQILGEILANSRRQRSTRVFTIIWLYLMKMTCCLSIHGLLTFFEMTVNLNYWRTESSLTSEAENLLPKVMSECLKASASIWPLISKACAGGRKGVRQRSVRTGCLRLKNQSKLQNKEKTIGK